MHFALVDDDLYFLKELKRELEKQFCNIAIDCYQRVDDAFYLKHYDAYFLDIEMQDHGLVVAQRLREQDKQAIIIFITSHTEFSCDVYRLKVFWFIEKSRMKELLPEVCLSLKDKFQHQYLSVKNNKGDIIYLPIQEIISAIKLGNQIIVKTKVDTYALYDTMKKFYKRLPSTTFYMVKSGVIINSQYIASYNEKKHKLTLTNGDWLVVSRQFRLKRTLWKEDRHL